MTISGAFVWTELIEAELALLWASGFTASQIALKLGAVSRSAIIGKVHRLHLAKRDTVVRGRARPPGAPKQVTRLLFKKAKTVMPRKFDMPDPKVMRPPDVARVTFMDLEPQHCRFPVGDPRSQGFGFCGDQKIDGLPYCATHASACYRPPIRTAEMARAEAQRRRAS